METEPEHCADELAKKKLKVSNGELKVVSDEKINVEGGPIGMKFKIIRCQVCCGCKATLCGDHTYSQTSKMFLSQNSNTCLNPKFETSISQNVRDKNGHPQVNPSDSDPKVASSNVNVKKRKVRKDRARRILCQDCPGCQAKSCGNCKFCNTDKKELCNTKHCSQLRWESVPCKKYKSGEAETESLPDKRSSVGVIDGVSYDFRCTICKIIPVKPNRSELYRHYSTEHFKVQLLNEFGHLNVCPFCNKELRIKGKNASHFGQKHDMVEKFLPEGVRIPRRLTAFKLSQRRMKYESIRPKKIISVGVEVEAMEESIVWPDVPEKFDPNGVHRRVECSPKEALKVMKIDGFEIEFMKDMEEDINGNLTEEKVIERIDQTSLNASDQVQLVLCKVCKQKFSGVETTVLHIQTDHHIKGPDSIGSHFQSLVRSGYVSVIAPDKVNTSQDDLVLVDVPSAASKMVAAYDWCKADATSNLFMAKHSSSPNHHSRQRYFV